MIIGLCGYKGSGKTTIATEAVRTLHPAKWQRIGFSDPIIAMLETIGVPQHVVNDKTLWNEPLDILCGKTLRHAVQSLGTAWGREHIGEDVWTRIAIRRAEAYHGRNVIIDNVRFPNEAEAIRNVGGLVIRFERPGMDEPTDPHPSEQFIKRIYCESTFVNVGSVAESADNFRNLITELTRNA